MSMIDQVNFTSNSFENMLNGMISGNDSADISNNNIQVSNDKTAYNKIHRNISENQNDLKESFNDQNKKKMM